MTSKGEAGVQLKEFMGEYVKNENVHNNHPEWKHTNANGPFIYIGASGWVVGWNSSFFHPVIRSNPKTAEDWSPLKVDSW